MFSIFKKAQKVEKVNLHQVAEVLGNRRWEHEIVSGKENTIIVHGKYRSQMRDFYRLYLEFVGANVKFKDQKGTLISEVSRDNMYPEMMDILNVIN